MPVHHKDTKGTKVEDLDNGLSRKIIGLAIEVHRQLGPGLLESAYEECLSREFEIAGIPFQRQIPCLSNTRGYGWNAVAALIWWSPTG